MNDQLSPIIRWASTKINSQVYRRMSSSTNRRAFFVRHPTEKRNLVAICTLIEANSSMLSIVYFKSIRTKIDLFSRGPKSAYIRRRCLLSMLLLKERDNHLHITLDKSFHKMKILRTEMDSIVKELDVLFSNTALNR